MGEGDVLEGAVSFILSNDMTATFDAGLAAAGYESSFSAEGGLVNFIYEAAGEPVADASVASTAGTCPAFYNTGIGEGGFSLVDDEGAAATATGADGLAILPGAPITTYEVTHETMAFESATMGSLPGIALFVSMTEDTAE